MKKYLTVIISAAFALTILAGCGRKNTGEEPSPSPDSQAVVMTAQPETSAPAGQTYGSMENLLAVTLPDGTWLMKEDTYGKMCFQSAGRGDIYVFQAGVWDEGNIKMPEAASGVRDILKAVSYVGAYETVSFSRGTAVWVDTFEAELKLTPADAAPQYKTCMMYGAQNSDSVVIAVGMLASEDQKDKDMLMTSLKTISKGTEEEIGALQSSSAGGYSSGSDSRNGTNDSQGGSDDSQSGRNDSEDDGYDGGAASGSGDENSGSSSDSGSEGDDGSGDGSLEENYDGSGDGYDGGDGGSSDGSDGGSDQSDNGGEENGQDSSDGEDGDSYEGAGGSEDIQ